MGAIAKIPVRMTVAEFLAWDAGDGRLWQLVDGEPQAMAPASRTHGAIQAELCRLVANHLAERSSLCSVLANPGVVPRVQAEHNVRIPDLAVICSDYEADERGRDVGQCLGLYDDSERPGNRRFPHRFVWRRSFAPLPGWLLAQDAGSDRIWGFGPRKRRVPDAAASPLQDDAPCTPVRRPGRLRVHAKSYMSHRATLCRS
jgi:Putative restriction endonuclease